MLNADGFISLFCENVNKPALKCNGKCQLSKMAKEQQKEQAEKVLLNLQQEVFLCHQINCSEDFPLAVVTQISIAPTLFSNSHYAYLYYFRNDKPPQFLS